MVPVCTIRVGDGSMYVKCEEGTTGCMGILPPEHGTCI